MRRKYLSMLALALTIAIGLSIAGPCLALDIVPEDPPDDPSADLPEDPEVGEDKTEVFERIVATFPELELTVEQLQLHFDEGWGLGELVICSVMAADSAKPFEEVLSMAASGMGWGEIAKAVDMESKNLGQAVSSVMGKKGLLWKGYSKDVEDALEGRTPRGNAYGHDPAHKGKKSGTDTNANTKSESKGKPDKAGKPDNPNKPKSDNHGKGQGKKK